MAVGHRAVRLRDLRKRFARRGAWILDGLDLTIPPGSLTVIRGDNGSGKSTLLRIAAGAAEPTSGTVRDRPARVGYVPERLPARMRFTARQYAVHMGRIRGLSDETIRRRADELFARLALTPGDDRPIATLSKGNSQKVALTQAFLAPAGLLVLDEPFAGLDGDADDVLTAVLREARDDGAAILLSAHDAASVPDADTVHELSGGRLTPAEVGTPHPPHRTVTVTLTPAAPDPVDLSGVAGVLGVHRDGSHLTVRTTRSDDLLRAALTGGWSVVEVR